MKSQDQNQHQNRSQSERSESILYLPLKRKWFDEIKSGVKKFEYRLYNDHWKKRLIGKEFTKIILTLGYPKKDDHERRIEKPFKGFHVITMQHTEFGDEPQKCFAIYV